MERIVPLISPSVRGPLGVAHLPRLWLKATLNAVDMLWEGYFPDYKGFNQLLADAIGLEPEALFGFLQTLPSYPATERWVQAHATKLDPASVAAINELIVTRPRPADAAAAVRARVGLDAPEMVVSQRLIDLDDWFTMHEYLVARKGAHAEPIVPTVSSSSHGPLGAKHLPRLWMKALLTGVGALPEGYNSGFGFDATAARTLGFDLAAACAFIHAELPNYLVFEDWIRTNLGALDPATLASYNEMIVNREKPPEKAEPERIECGVPEMSFVNVILLNDMLDWAAHHQRIVARRVRA